MTTRLKEVIGTLDYHELVRMRADVDTHISTIRTLVQERIDDLARQHTRECASCQSPLKPFSTSNLTLLFGPHDFKKKASFCGMDCLQYFLEELKELKKEVPTHAQHE